MRYQKIQLKALKIIILNNLFNIHFDTILKHLFSTRLSSPSLSLRKLALFISIISLSACSVVSVKKQDPVKQLMSQRNNIVTNDTLSNNSRAMIHLTGLNEKKCFNEFEKCLKYISDNQHIKQSPKELAVLAELHYAYAQQLESSINLDSRFKINHLLKRQKKSKISTQKLSQVYLNHLLMSVRYSYAYLFYPNLTHLKHKPNLPSDLDIQTRDIYNAVSHKVINQLYQNTNKNTKKVNSSNSAKIEYADINNTQIDSITNKKTQIKVLTKSLDVGTVNNHINLYLPNEKEYLSQIHKNHKSKIHYAAIDNLIPANTLKLSGLKVVSKREGIGISYVSQLTNRHTINAKKALSSGESVSLINPIHRIHPTGNLLLTAVLQPHGSSVNNVITSKSFDLHFYNPHNNPKVNILGFDYPLTGSFSASYGLWIHENEMKTVGLINMLHKKKLSPLPHLFMLEPYNPNKKVIIMLHGLASSPATWVGLTNDILNDEALRDNYQVWQVFYSTNLPILENRYHIQQLIKTNYHQTDPQGQSQASHNSVIVGHSMGGVISRMLVSDDDLSLNLKSLVDKANSDSMLSSSVSNTKNSKNPTKKTSKIKHKNTQVVSEKQQQFKLRNALRTQQLTQAYKKPIFKERFKLNHLPQIDTAIFISAPMRGTDFADKWFTKALRGIIQLPLELTDVENIEEASKNTLASLFLQNGASQLSDSSAFMHLTGDIKINQKVTFHSIMGSIDMNTEGDFTDGKVMLSQKPSITINKDTSDGIVPYTSSHLDGATSENIIAGGHDIHTETETVTQLRKILHQHLKKTHTVIPSASLTRP